MLKMNSSKVSTESLIPIKDINNNVILLENGLKVAGVKV